MVDFTRQRAFKTREAVLPVDKGLPPGIHIFQLVVTDERGNQSKVAQVKVEIVENRVPVIPIPPVRPVRPVRPGRPTRPGRRPKPG